MASTTTPGFLFGRERIAVEKIRVKPTLRSKLDQDIKSQKQLRVNYDGILGCDQCFLPCRYFTWNWALLLEVAWKDFLPQWAYLWPLKLMKKKKKEWGSLYRHHYSKHWILARLEQEPWKWAISKFHRIIWIWGMNVIHWFQSIAQSLLNKISMKFHHFLSSFLGDSNTNGSQFEEGVFEEKLH